MREMRMMTSAAFDLSTYLKDRRARVDAALRDALPAPGDDDPGALKEGMRYAVLQGGKRMRPMVTIAACEAVGGAADDALPPSCAVEMIHAYSLVHDDLPAMDNDLERRGLPTVHVKFGQANAILVGDALLTHAFTVLGVFAHANVHEAVIEDGSTNEVVPLAASADRVLGILGVAVALPQQFRLAIAVSSGIKTVEPAITTSKQHLSLTVDDTVRG